MESQNETQRRGGRCSGVSRIRMFSIGQAVEVYFEGETPKWKIAYIANPNTDGSCLIKMASNGKYLLIKKDDIRVPNYSHDYSRGFTYGLTHREYIAGESDEWHRGYIMGVVARVGG
jgi:hypothetical protein